MSATQEVVQESLSDILSGKDPEEVSVPEPQGEEKAAPPAAGNSDKQEQVKPEAKAEPKTEETSKDAPKSDGTPTGALIAMSRRLQAAESRVRELEAGKPAEKVSIFDNEDEAINQRMQARMAPLENTVFELRLELAKAKYPKFDEAARAFYEAAQADPVLMHQADTSPDPYAFVYREGNRIKELGPYGGDFGKYREAVVSEKDARIKLLEAQVAELNQQKTDLESLPRSLNSKSSGASPKVGEEDDEDIKSITRFGNKQR